MADISTNFWTTVFLIAAEDTGDSENIFEKKFCINDAFFAQHAFAFVLPKPFVSSDCFRVPEAH
jgi:hypothetical protein